MTINGSPSTVAATSPLPRCHPPGWAALPQAVAPACTLAAVAFHVARADDREAVRCVAEVPRCAGRDSPRRFEADGFGAPSLAGVDDRLPPIAFGLVIGSVAAFCRAQPRWLAGGAAGSGGEPAAAKTGAQRHTGPPPDMRMAPGITGATCALWPQYAQHQVTCASHVTLGALLPGVRPTVAAMSSGVTARTSQAAATTSKGGER